HFKAHPPVNSKRAGPDGTKRREKEDQRKSGLFSMKREVQAGSGKACATPFPLEENVDFF
ncbi:MAG: hypothetical protein ACE5GQ_07945, partial [Nitrospinales bacterium]